MSVFQRLSDKVKAANTSAANARNAWRDDTLSRREHEANGRDRELSARQLAIADQLKELRRLESRVRRRKVLYACCVVIGAIPSFLIGFGAGRSGGADVFPPPGIVPAKTVTMGKIEQPHQSNEEINSSDTPPTIRGCVDRGIAYFKEIGSYPTLHSAPDTGRLADDVARERCMRTTTAFGPWP